MQVSNRDTVNVADNIVSSADQSEPCQLDHKNNADAYSIEKINDVVKYLPTIALDGDLLKQSTPKVIRYVVNNVASIFKSTDFSTRMLDFICLASTPDARKNDIFFHTVDSIRKVILIGKFAFSVVDHIEYYNPIMQSSDIQKLINSYPALTKYMQAFNSLIFWNCLNSYMIDGIYHLYESKESYILSDGRKLMAIDTNIAAIYPDLSIMHIKGSLTSKAKCNETSGNDSESYDPRMKDISSDGYVLIKMTHEYNGSTICEYGLILCYHVKNVLGINIYGETDLVADNIMSSLVKHTLCTPGNAAELCLVYQASRTFLSFSSSRIRDGKFTEVNTRVSESIIKGVNYIFTHGGHRGFAFIGKPGSGKTSMLATIIRRFSNILTITVSPDLPLYKYNWRTIFDISARIDSVIIYLDDLDSYYVKEKNENVVSLIALFESLNAKNINYIFMCTANNAKDINPSLIGRGDRIDEVIEFSSLSETDIKEAFIKSLSIECISDECQSGIEELASKEITYSDVNNIITMLNIYYDGNLTKESLEFAISRVSSSKNVARLDDTV